MTLEVIRRLSQLLTVVQGCQAQIEQNQAIFDEFERWCKIRSNIERCRTDLQSSSPDPGSPDPESVRRRQEFESQLAEIQSSYLLANYQVIRSYEAVRQAKACLDTVRKAAQLLGQSLILDERSAETLARLAQAPDLDGLERLIPEMIELARRSTPRARGGQPDEQVSEIRERVKRCWLERGMPSNRTLCNYLDEQEIPRPPHVKWPGTTWKEAFEKKRGPVDNWLSGFRKSSR